MNELFTFLYIFCTHFAIKLQDMKDTGYERSYEKNIYLEERKYHKKLMKKNQYFFFRFVFFSSVDFKNYKPSLRRRRWESYISYLFINIFLFSNSGILNFRWCHIFKNRVSRSLIIK